MEHSVLQHCFLISNNRPRRVTANNNLVKCHSFCHRSDTLHVVGAGGKLTRCTLSLFYDIVAIF
jgi:hypothetical protein